MNCVYLSGADGNKEVLKDDGRVKGHGEAQNPLDAQTWHHGGRQCYYVSVQKKRFQLFILSYTLYTFMFS